MSKMLLFYGGQLSQWFSSDFTVDGVQYNCAEQYMMAMKAKTFRDEEALEAIMKAKDPWTQKAVGRRVKNFDPIAWNAVAKGVVYTANLAKFSEPRLKKFLLNTDDLELVEASPTDCIWGIGLSATDPRAQDKSKWRGTNWLGEVLMLVRSTLRG